MAKRRIYLFGFLGRHGKRRRSAAAVEVHSVTRRTRMAGGGSRGQEEFL